MGLLYRSTALHHLEGDDVVAFASLGIRTVYDLRTQPERAAEPDRLPQGTEYVVADVIGDADRGSPAQLVEIVSKPEVAHQFLGDGRGVAMWMEHYRDFVRLVSARAAYGRLFSGVACEARRPALFHCSTGKDRTGWATAALLLLLDVPYDIVMEDFLKSTTYLRPHSQAVRHAFAARGGDPDLLRPITEVLPEYLDAALEEVRRSFGSIGGYFITGLKLDAETIRALCDALLAEA